MNIQVGKSAGIALLMAAALLAALFAMGVFSPSGAGAAKLVPTPTAELSNTRVNATGETTQKATLTLTFELNNDVNSSGTAVTIDLPNGQTPTGADPLGDLFDVAGALALTTSNVTVEQNGDDVGSIAVADGGQTITINAPTGSNGVPREDTLTTVTISGLTLEDTPATSAVRISQGTDAALTNTIGIFDPSVVPTSASAYIGEVDSTLVIKFTTQSGTGDVTIDPPNKYILSNSNVMVDGATGPTITADVDEFAITGVAANTEITVTITLLSNLEEGDEITLSMADTGYAITLEVGGRSISPTTGTDATGCAGLSSCNADAAVSVEVSGTATAAMTGGSNFVISMPGFQVPSSIDRDEVIIDANYAVGPPATGYFGEPADVDVGGTAAARTITLRLPARQPNQARDPVNILAATAYTITFNKAAGIQNPNSAGTKTITVQDGDPAADNHEMDVVIVSHVSVSNPKSGWVQRGDEVEVTAKGINAKGDATVHLHTAHTADDIEELEEMLDDGDLSGEDLAALPALDRSSMDGGTAVLNFNTSSSIFNAQAVDATQTDSAEGTNVLIVVDAAGNITGWTRLGLTPKVTLNLEEVRRTGRMGVTVSDWYYGGVSNVRVNGIQVSIPDPNDAEASAPWPYTVADGKGVSNGVEFTVVVPRRARLGEMEVAVYGTTYDEQGTISSLDNHKQTVNVGVFDLTIRPSTAVTDQVIRIEGDGFGPTQCITSIKVGDENIRRATTGDQVRIGAVADCVTTDSDGTLSNSFNVPHNLDPGDYPVVITDALNRVGQGELTIPEPAIRLEPKVGDPPIASSQRGSTVTVIGENFPAEDVVGITYGADPVTVATTDTVGKWRATFKVPVDATIGRTYEVVAQSEKKGTGMPRVVTGQDTVSLNAKAEHTVPEEILTVDPEAVSSGQRLTIKAENLPLFTPVGLTIGGLGVAGRAIGEDDASDGFGRYEKVLLVPQLTVGTHNVELRVHTVGSDVVVVTFVDILDIVTRPTNEVFADLIEAGQLTSVWRYRIDESGSDWDSFDPQFVGQPGINDLETVSTRDIVWIRVTENVTFQGAPLFAGWNLRTLE